MSRAGTAVVADIEIATFFLKTRQGLLALVVIGAIMTAITALELTCLMAIGLEATNGPRHGPQAQRASTGDVRVDGQRRRRRDHRCP